MLTFFPLCFFLLELRKFYTAHPEKLSPLVKYNPLVRYLATRNNEKKIKFDLIVSIIVSIFKTLIDIPYELMEGLLHNEKNNLHGVELSGRKIYGISQQFDLQLFKDIATARKCSVNDIVTSCALGAFKKEDPDAASIRVFIALGGLLPGSFGTQNTTSVTKFEVEFRNAESHLDRLKRASQKLQRLKSSSSSLGNLILAFITGNHLPSFCKKFLSLDGTIGISNMFGPPLEISVMGDKATDVVYFPMNFFKTGKNFWID